MKDNVKMVSEIKVTVKGGKAKPRPIRKEG